MNKSILSLLAAGGAVLLVAGCSTHDKGPYLPEGVKTPAYEGREPVVLVDPGVQYSVTCVSLQEQILPDGRLEVIAHLRNRENRRISRRNTPSAYARRDSALYDKRSRA